VAVTKFVEDHLIYCSAAVFTSHYPERNIMLCWQQLSSDDLKNGTEGQQNYLCT